MVMAGLFMPLIAQAVLPLAPTPLPASDPCLFSDSRALGQRARGRSITAMDQATMANIGRTDTYDWGSSVGVSPDGRQIAFLVQRGNPHANAYCQQLMVMPLDASAGPWEITRGGEFIRALGPLRSFPAVRTGSAQVITPKWSPDGARIGFLRRVDGSTQVWAIDAQGRYEARRLTALPDDVDDFAWSADGRGVVVATRPDLRLKTEAIETEARSGFVYDDRFIPSSAARPLPTGAFKTAYTLVDTATGLSREAGPTETLLLEARTTPDRPSAARLYEPAPGGGFAMTVAKDPDNLLTRTKVVVVAQDGTRIECTQRLCEGSQHLWWSRDGRSLFILHRTGWAESQTGLLRWDIGKAGPSQVLVTDDVLIGCVMVAEEIICAREGSMQPRRLVAIDRLTGRQRIVFDPNPQFAGFTLGRVQRFRFHNSIGVESFADLVLPPGHKPGEKHPLVVVQYGSQGFLRGGTDDEVPIQVLAAKGFAVLSFERPFLPAEMLNVKTGEEYTKAVRKNWIDRRSVQSSLEMALALAIKTGTVDAARMGISGFSDGTSTTQWALINSSLFKVASMGACCEDMYSYLLQAGPEFERYLKSAGYPLLERGAEEWWKPLSLILNVDRIDAPILVQTGDSEYTIGLDTAAVFRRRGKPFELIVLPDEPHFKWQPAHRLAIYERSVEWFQFWLMHSMNCDDAKAGQYRRWQSMRGAPGPKDLACESHLSQSP
jgi:dipeptidyl aminopeptidase/acylaminoacyl peptidase